MTKISVIIPVYNTAKYLTKCLDSVCSQTLKDIEVICINDCSTDNSLEILQNYAANDSRIKIINFTENKGAAAARNQGIDIAQGEYLGFIDSDDYPETNNFFEKLYNRAKETDADIVKGDYKNSDGFIDKNINNYIKKDKNNFCSTYCSAIFKSDLLNKNNIRFPILRDMEDPVFAFKCALKANMVEVVDDLYIVITKREDSITAGIPSEKQIGDKIEGLSIIFNLDVNCHQPYVLAFWFNTIMNDSLKNGSNNIKRYLFEKGSILLDKVIYNRGFIAEHSKYNDSLFNAYILKKLVDKYDVISFDIFDTLLLRPFKEPTDLFLYLKKYTNTQHNFYNDRITAEKAARFFNLKTKKGTEDITYDDIYKNLNKKYPEYKQLELDIEYNTLQKNREIADIYDYAIKKGKKVIIVSDMYLPSNFLAEVLEAKGYKGYHKLYVSSETKLCKCTGNMFKYILHDLNINTDSILHIGDNINSDFNAPSALGIASFCYTQVKKRYPEEELGFNILLKHNYKFEGNFWQNLAYYQGGPLLLSFIQNIEDTVKARSLTDLFFVARDGYLIKKAYEILYPDSKCKTHYVYASRKICRLYQNIPLDDSKNEYTKYSKSIILGGNKIGIVDTCAGNFSAQKLIERYWSDNSFIGIYLATHLNHKFNYINLSFNEHKDSKLGFKWDVIETLLSSPEAPVEDISNCLPVYRNNLNKEDKFISSIFPYLEEGQLRYINDIKEICGNFPIKCFEVYDVFENIKKYWENLTTKDIEMLDQIKHPVDASQTMYLSLVSDKKEKVYYENN